MNLFIYRSIEDSKPVFTLTDEHYMVVDLSGHNTPDVQHGRSKRAVEPLTENATIYNEGVGLVVKNLAYAKYKDHKNPLIRRFLASEMLNINDFVKVSLSIHKIIKTPPIHCSRWKRFAIERT